MNDDPAIPPTSRPRWQTWLAGVVLGDLAIAVQYAAGIVIMNQFRGGARMGWPSLLLVPALGGLIASYVWRTLRPPIGYTVLNTLWMTLLALLIAAVAFREGVICLLILSPIFFVSALTGTLVGRVLFKIHPTSMHLTVLPLLAVAIAGEPLTRVDRENFVTDEVVIHAPVARVWPHVKAFPPIPSTPRFWLFRMGLPYPMETTATGDFVNAERQCIFSHSAIFKEKVVELVPEKRLTFDILESPPDPELVGHLTPHRGQFVLRANQDGTTTLAGTTWYTLHVRPLWYFDLWTHHIFRAVHLRVMEDIRRRAEL